MLTTAVVAEILIVGLEAATWVSLLVLAIFGNNWVHPAAVKDWSTLVTVLVLAAAYVLGVLVDRFADSTMGCLVDRWPVPVDTPAGLAHMRLSLLARDDGVAKFVEYQRSRMRIARATVLNLLFVLLALPLFLALQTHPDEWAVLGAGP